MARIPPEQTSAMTTYEALCWGGSQDGKWWASPEPELRVAWSPPLNLTLDEPPDVAVPYHVQRYRFERIAFGPLTFGAWVIDTPPERREATKQFILDGLNGLYALARMFGGW